MPSDNCLESFVIKITLLMVVTLWQHVLHQLQPQVMEDPLNKNWSATFFHSCRVWGDGKFPDTLPRWPHRLHILLSRCCCGSSYSLLETFVAIFCSQVAECNHHQSLSVHCRAKAFPDPFHFSLSAVRVPHFAQASAPFSSFHLILCLPWLPLQYVGCHFVALILHLLVLHVRLPAHVHF